MPNLLSQADLDYSRPSSKFAKGTLFLININEEGRHALTIDAVFGLYLIDVSEQVVVNFYKLVCCLVQLLRNCINEYAFEVLTGIKPIEADAAM